MIPLPERLENIPWDDANESDVKLRALITNAKELYKASFQSISNHHHHPPAFIVAAPGRVNLIGEHTDYCGGYVLPLAVDYCTVCYGTGHLHTSKGHAATQITFRIVSDQVRSKPTDAAAAPVVEERTISCLAEDLRSPMEMSADDNNNNTNNITWVNYVLGVIVQFIPDLPQQGCVLDIAMSYSSNVPLGSGLSSSASLEVATALFLECILQDMAYSSCTTSTGGSPLNLDIPMERAVRCQRAENEWALSPCGIMDQMASSYCKEGHCMLLDCKTMDVTHVPMKTKTEEDPVLVICNSGVTHAIQADAEYGKRRKECSEATNAIQSVPLYHVEQLRDANVKDVEEAYAANKLDDVLYKRALHVVTENRRVMECKTALKLGLWDKVGALMNQSQDSLRDNFDVSCEEIDYLVEMARSFNDSADDTNNSNNSNVSDGSNQQQGESQVGDFTENENAGSAPTTTSSTTTHPIVKMYGSRLTGGGFGGCTVSLVPKQYAAEFIHMIQTKYQEKYNIDCNCFMTTPKCGARVVAIDLSL